jgi:VanZ family protein
MQPGMARLLVLRTGFMVGSVAAALAALLPAPVPLPPGGGDLLLHALGFCLLTACGWFGFAAGPERLWALGWCLLLALGLEAAQTALPHRTASPTDTAANLAGVIAAIAAGLLSRRFTW